MNYESAELSKLSINIFLASSVTVTNLLARIARNIGADWDQIIPALKLDKRIGQYAYLKSGLGLSGGNIERDLFSIKSIIENDDKNGRNLINSIVDNSKYMKKWAEKILEKIDEILEDKIEFKEQDHSKATYASKIEKLEGKINWSEAAENIIGKVNGLYPSPSAFFIYKGERYKILKAEIGNGVGKPGEIVSNYLEVVCGDKQTIKIKEIQRQGKKPQNIGEFMLGSQIKRGSNLNNA